MTSANYLRGLADRISTEAAAVATFAESHNIQLSFAPDAPDPAHQWTGEFATARSALLESATTLLDLITGPSESIHKIVGSGFTGSSLRVIYKYDLFNAVPLEGDASYTAVADKVGLDVSIVERVLQHAMGSRIFHQPSVGHVAHSAISAAIAKSRPLQAYVGHCVDDLHVYGAHLADALEKWGSTQEPNETGFNIVHNTNETFFKHIERDPKKLEEFSNVMKFVSTLPHTGANHVVDGYPWGKLGDATIIDVGGSQGHICIALARKFQNLQFIVQDYGPTCKVGEAALPPELKDRIAFQPHDFFRPQPKSFEGKVVYYLRMILHDWSDKYAAMILRPLVENLKKGDRIVINDRLIPEPGTTGQLTEKIGHTLDLQMLSIANGRERTEKQFKALFRTVDPKLRMRIHSNMPDAFALIEVEMD